MFRFGRVGRSIALISTLTLGACADGEPAGPEGEESEDGVVEQAALPLVEGRTVEVQKWSNGIPSKARQSLASASSGNVMTSIFRACAQSEIIALTGGGSTPPADTTKQTACDAVPTFLDRNGFSASSSTPAYSDQLTLLCAAHWSLQLAESTSTTYVIDDIPALVVKRRDKLEAPWSQIPFFANNPQWIADDKMLKFTIEPPDASDAASWALLATELYREAALAAQQILSTPACTSGGLAYDLQAFDGRQVNLLEQMAANLVDSISSMNEAAEKAQKHVGAAAQAKRSESADPVEGLTAAWRGRSDSRLEGASIYTKVSEGKFERPQLVPLWWAASPDLDPAASGFQQAAIYTTAPDALPTGYYAIKVVGWVYPPVGPAPANTLTLTTYRLSPTSGVYATADAGATWLDSHLGMTKVTSRVEGYVPTANSDPNVAINRMVKSTTTPTRFKWIGTKEAVPTGWAVAHYPSSTNEDWVRTFVSEESPIQLYAATQKLPVQTLLPAGRSDSNAETLLRTSRVNFCLDTTGACAGAFRAGRTAQLIADDIVKVNKAEKGVGPATTQAMLDQFGITLNDIEYAAKRLSQEAAILGRTYVADPAWPAAVDDPATQGYDERTRPARMFGSEFSDRPAHPAFLYAQTAGEVDFSRGAVTDYIYTWTGATIPVVTRGLPYARTSTIAALDYIKMKLDASVALLTGAEKATPWARMLQEASALCRQHLEDAELARPQTLVQPIQIGIQRAGSSLSAVSVLRQNLPYATTADLLANCDAWLGDAGLECALTGAVGGSVCDPSRYKFTEATDAGSATKWAVDTSTKWATFGLDSTEAPTRLGSSTTTFKEGERIYVTCNVANKNRAVAAMTVTTPPADGSWRAYLPPFSDSLKEALSNLLAADTKEPSQAQLSCAGVPYDVKVGPEDELIQAFTGNDGIESSFAYYLGLAREASERADSLGDQLIEQGLQMDLRAEGARDELESLCGGVINVGNLEAQACLTHGCDIVKLMTDSAVTVSGALKSELAGLADCLGIGAPPTWAAVGDQDLCIWQYYPQDGAMPPPMECPSGVAACAGLSTSVLLAPPSPVDADCRGNALCPENCAEMYNLDGSKVTMLPSGNPPKGKVYASKVTEKLSMQITGLRSQDTSSDPTVFGCGNMIALRRPREKGNYTGNPSGPSGSKFNFGASLTAGSLFAQYTKPAWATQAEMAKIAEAIGYEEDIYGFGNVTVNGRDWIKLGNPVDGPYTPQNAPFTWPYLPHPAVDRTKAVYDFLSAASCGGTYSKDMNGVYTWDPNNKPIDSLLCGGKYVEGGHAAMAKRLRDAVIALKGVTGASFDNVTVRRVTPGDGSLAVEGNLQQAGELPDWFVGGRAGSDYWLAPDRQSMAYWGTNRGYTAELGGFTDRHRSAKRPSVFEKLLNRDFLPDEFRPFGTGGWIDAKALWAPGATPIKGEGRFVGNGDMIAFVQGEYTPIRSQMLFNQHTYCQGIPKGVQGTFRLSGCKLLHPSPPTSAVEQCTARNGRWSDYTDSLVGADSLGRNAYRCSCFPSTYISAKGLRDIAEGAGKEFDEIFPTAIAARLEPYACAHYPQLTVGTEVPYKTMVDAMELACAAQESGQASCTAILADVPRIRGVEDFSKLRARVNCAADGVEQSVDRMYLAGVPPDVARDLAGGGLVQTFPAHRGQYGATVATLGAQVSAMYGHGYSVSAAMRDVGTILDRAQNQLRALDLDMAISDVDTYISAKEAALRDNGYEIDNIRTRQAIANSATSCITALATATSNFTGWFNGDNMGKTTAAIATCANSALQITSELQIKGINNENRQIAKDISAAVQQKIDLQQQVTAEEKNALLLSIVLEISDKMDDINLALVALKTAQAEVHGTLAQLDAQRSQARRAAAKVLMLDNDDVGRQYSVNTGMRARMNTLAYRYEKARDNAVRMAFIARRAVEQRLGVDLSLMDSDMTLVDAPSSWVDKLCSSSGIDYSKVRTGGKNTTTATTSGTTVTVTSTEEQAQSKPSYDYSEAYVGDWVGQLENFVRSYRLDYPSGDGQDVAVISLRDEILAARQACTIPSANRLRFSDGVLMSALPTDEDSADEGDGPPVAEGWENTCSGTTQAVSAPAVSPFACTNTASAACRSLGRTKGWSVGRATVSTCPSDAATETCGPSSDRVGRWSFDEAFGTIASDSSGNPNHATLMDGPLWTSGVVRNSIQFDGQNDRIHVPDSPAVQYAGGDMSISFWLNPDVAEDGGYVVSKPLNGTGRYNYILQYQTTGRIGALLMAGNAGSYSLWSTPVVTKEAWHHVALTVGADKSVRLYIDGTLNVSGTHSITSWAPDSGGTGSLPLTLGYVYPYATVPIPSTTSAFKGGLDEFAIHDRVLPASEVASLYSSPDSANTSQPSLCTPAESNGSNSGPARLRQTVELGAGDFLLSWYQEAYTMSGASRVNTPPLRVRIENADGTTQSLPLSSTTANTIWPAAEVGVMGSSVPLNARTDPWLRAGWVRYFVPVSIAKAGTVAIGFEAPTTATLMAGPQLERRGSQLTVFPSEFFPTSTTTDGLASTCEDTEGNEFRRRFTRGCEYYCPTGTTGSCFADGRNESLPSQCYYEVDFALSVDDIESGGSVQQAGFAKGNFNYRFDTIAVNLVGTSVRDCSRSANRSACYAGSFLQYSLHHEGPFRTRNYDGELYENNLYNGVIQQAKGLLAERYITNPLSSADRGLLQDYFRAELRGRPIDGRFKLRIYDADGLDWNALEDVQLVTNYRYWTKSQ